KESWLDLPNLVRKSEEGFQRNPPLFFDLKRLPSMTRSFVDNGRYFREGGQAGVETKRGCPRDCIYCADPVAKGKNVRTRPPREVADELEHLVRQGIDAVHLCDSEFNIPLWHALAVCKEISSRGLADRLRWYTYCSPVPFSRKLARKMAGAGCAGINFGVDSGDHTMLLALGRSHTPGDIRAAVDFCREEGITVMLDLLIGAPGESRESIMRTVDLMKEVNPDRVGVAAGVRVYPGTSLSRMVESGSLHEGITGGENIHDPLFFMEPKIGDNVFAFLDHLIGDDERFFFFDPDSPKRNYNYNANQRLAEAIEKG
ncbi:MAG: radical SAM protein, partial [Deltaproteobacteria bacterium]|nr:radical SAM protein [Deltaproteobacteria bacterium]NIS77354.1 radical SAM protein [Deltaproteobacteria bacterium]